MNHRIVILGAAGGFGRLLARLLTEEGDQVTGVDKVGVEQEDRRTTFFAADTSCPDDALIGCVADADWVISCMPLDATLDGFQRLTPFMAPHSLFADILSVKTQICGLMEAARPDIECVSLHPMFAPSVPFPDQNVVLVDVRSGARSASLVSYLRKWGAKIHHLSAEQHDSRMAMIQAATHTAILAFGMALRSAGNNLTDVIAISSPPHRLMLAMLARIVTGNVDVYWQIQTENPRAERARVDVAAGAESLQVLCRNGNLAEFTEFFRDVRELLHVGEDELNRLAKASFALPFPEIEPG